MRKKLVIIAMAVLALLTAQCKKNEPKPSDDVMVPITGTVNFGGSKTLINTTGQITPQNGDVIYIYYGEQDNAYQNVGSLTCSPTGGQNFNFTGQIQGGCLGKTCTFMYLGTGSKEADGTTNISKTSTTISFASQSDVSVSGTTIANLNKFHVGSCKATVSQEGTVTLSMSSKMAIAYFQLKDKDSSSDEFKNATITISDLYATADIDMANGTLKGKELGDVTVKTDANGCFYMALIPQTDPQSNPVKFTFKSYGYHGESSFSNGIVENCFYSNQGQGSPLQVEMIAGAPIPSLPGSVSNHLFSVASGKQVYFSKGNLQCVKTGDTWANGYTWKFADNQLEVVETGNVSDNYANQDKIGLFGWGTSGITPPSADSYYQHYQPWSTDQSSTGHSSDYNSYGYGPSTNREPESERNLLVSNGSDWGSNAISYGNGQTEPGKWRTPTNDEWKYLFVTRPVSSDIRFVRATVNGARGLILVPDDWKKDTYPLNTATGFESNIIGMDDWTVKLEPAGCVFLPVAGQRTGGASVLYYNSHFMPVCFYWSSSHDGSDKAFYFDIRASNNITWSSYDRYRGMAVRLVYDYVKPAGK